MKSTDYHQYKSKFERIYDIFLENPDEIFNKHSLYNLFNLKYSDNLNYSSLSSWLIRLWKQNKVSRTPTQLNDGHYYTLKNKSRLEKLYSNYLLPYNLKNKQKLKSLILQNSFEDLRKNFKVNYPKNSKFFKKYGADYFNKDVTNIFLSKLVAFVIGDGHIRTNKGIIQLFFRKKFDAVLFKKDFLKYFNKENAKVVKKKYCYMVLICDRSLSSFLAKLGAPRGNKVFQPFLIPNWIYHGRDKIKLAFLSVIYGNEGSKPIDNRWRIQFVISKNKTNLNNLLVFLNQIRAMLNYFGISSSFIQLRKQRGRQFCGRFYIKGKSNLHKFYKLLEFSYASEKQEVLENLILKGNSSLK